MKYGGFQLRVSVNHYLTIFWDVGQCGLHLFHVAIRHLVERVLGTHVHDNGIAHQFFLGKRQIFLTRIEACGCQNHANGKYDELYFLFHRTAKVWKIIEFLRYFV
jgi:hypothetical protein